MGNFDSLFEVLLSKVLAEAPEPISEEEIPHIAQQVVAQMIPQLSEMLAGDLKARMPKEQRRLRREDAGFRKRNYVRWQPAFELLECMFQISMEVGSKYNTTTRPHAATEGDYVFEALVSLHARGLLVTREIICLMEGGFADGALSRWRALHEIAATASFIGKHGKEVAHRYLASRVFQSYRAAKQLAEYAERANMDPFSDDEVANMKAQCEAFEKRFDKRLREDYGWAANVFMPGSKITFSMIEKDVGLDHWRPRYRWASEHTHSPYRPPQSLLGTAESEHPVHLVGQSDSGMVDPFQMTAITLAVVSGALLTHDPSIDHVVAMSVLEQLSSELGHIAIKVEKDSFETQDAQKEVGTKEAD